MDNKSNTPMSCEQVDSLLNEYLDGELDAVTATAVEAHLAECDSCRQTYEQLRAICGAVGDLAEPVPDGLHKRIISAVRTEARSARRRRLTSRLGAGVAAMLCVGLVATAAVHRMSNVVNNDSDSRMSTTPVIDMCNETLYVAEIEAKDGRSRNDGSSSTDDPPADMMPASPQEGTLVSFSAENVEAQACTESICGRWTGDNWTLTLEASNSFTYTAKSHDTVSGEYSFSDGKIEFIFNGQSTVYDAAMNDGRITFIYRSGTPLFS